MKKLYFLLGILCALGFVACNNVQLMENKVGSVSFTLGDDLAREIRSVASFRSITSEPSYTVTGVLSGDYSADSSITVDSGALAKATFSFENIPVGISVTLHLTVQAGNNLVWIGNSESHKVVAGNNSLTVALGRVSGVLLWKRNVDSGNHDILTAPYGAYDSPADTGITFGASDSSQGTPFCFDGAGNLYVMPSDDQSLSEVKKYVLQPNGTYVDSNTNISTNGQVFNHLAYDSVAGILYGIGEKAGLYYSKSNGNFEPVQGDTVNSVSYLGLAAHDNVVYCATYTEEQEGDGPSLGVVQLSSYKLEDASDGTKTATSLLVDKKFTLLEVFGSNPPTCQMIYQDGALYLLLRRVEINDASNASVDFPAEHFSIGALVKINPTTLSLDTSFETGGYLGLSSMEKNFSGLSASGGTSVAAVDFYGSGNDASTFYGPVGFVAIMPKKLVIADAGFSMEQEGIKVNLTKKTRVITVDLETLAFDSIDIDNGYYQDEIYGSFSNAGYSYIVIPD